MSKKPKVIVAEIAPPKPLPHMKYNTFVILRDFLGEQKRRVHHEYINAADHTYEWDYDGMSPPQFKRTCKVLPQSVRDFMWKNYQKQMQYYEDMLKQLRYAAEESNRTNSNPNMRKFWCLDIASEYLKGVSIGTDGKPVES